MRHVAILAATSIAALSAAAWAAPKNAVPFKSPKEPTSFSQAERDWDGFFGGRPAVQRVRIPGGLFVSRPQHDLAPQSLLGKQIIVDIRTEVPTLADLQTVLDVQHVPMTIDWRSLETGARDATDVGSFTAASKYQKLANCVKGGSGVQQGGNGMMGGLGGSLGSSGGYGSGDTSRSIGSNSGNGSSGDEDCDIVIKGAMEESKGTSGSGSSAGSNSPDGDPRADQQADAKGAEVKTSAGARQLPKIFDRPLPFRYFKGTVGELLRRLESTGNIAVWYDGGLVVGDVRRYSIAVMQNQDIVYSIVKELKRLGAKDVVGSVGAGEIIYSAPPRTNGEVIEPYLRRLSGNLSEVTMEVALVTVNMTRSSEQGFDWSAFNFGYNANVTSFNAPGSGTTSGTGGSTTPSTQLKSGAFTLNTSAFNANLGDIFGAGKILTVAGAIKFLSKLGNTEVAQNVELRTLSGAPVILRSGEEIPYVSGVGTAVTGGLSGTSLGNSQTARLGTGLTMNVDPRYDSSSGIVTMDIGIKLVDLIDMVQLNAGNQLGTLTQPHTREQGLNSILRLSAGQTAILGGIRRDLSSMNRSGPFGAFGIGSKAKDREVFWLFAIVRPVVTVYETADAPVAPRSTLDTRTTVNPYDEGSYGEAYPPEPVASIEGNPQAQSQPRNVIVSSETTTPAVTPQPRGATAGQRPMPAAAAVPLAPPRASLEAPVLRAAPPQPAPVAQEPRRSFIRPMTDAEKRGN